MIFRLFIKVKLKAYLLWPFWEKFIFAIVAQSTVPNYTVIYNLISVATFLIIYLGLVLVHFQKD